VIETPEWMSDALCRKMHGDIFFPPFDAQTPEINYLIAKQVCNVCPVWDSCLSMGRKEIYGVWGGLTPQERVPLQKDTTNNLAEHGTVVRFRQGCACDDCDWAHTTRPLRNEIDVDVIPLIGEELPDLKILLQRLLKG
jgi:hypothetical protein